ncbi:MAG: hypothetical protein WCQ99_15570, partial [Pseudomonadota bacterium]
FEKCRAAVPPGPGAARSAGGYVRAAKLSFPLGWIIPAQAEALGRLAGCQGAAVRIENHHSVAVYAQHAEDMLGSLAAEPSLSGLAPGPDILSCPGTTWCGHAIIRTHAVEHALRKGLPADFKNAIRISGCPNGCGHAGVGQIGLVGRVRKAGDKNAEGVQVLSGGGMGKSRELAIEQAPFITGEDIASYINNFF